MRFVARPKGIGQCKVRGQDRNPDDGEQELFENRHRSPRSATGIADQYPTSAAEASRSQGDLGFAESIRGKITNA
jgi:hypothetical protein